jgi:predicted dehydrogenase
MEARTLGVGVIGAGWLGDVHARAWGRLPHHYPDLGVVRRFAAVAEGNPSALASAVARHRSATTYRDWRDRVADPAVDVVSVTAPNSLHRDIGMAVAQAGKHVWIEKPVGLSAADARAVAAAVASAGVQATVGFNYRAIPAVAWLRELVEDGAIGTPTHARVMFMSDYAAHPLGLHTWRFGAGGLGLPGSRRAPALPGRRVRGPAGRAPVRGAGRR